MIRRKRYICAHYLVSSIPTVKGIFWHNIEMRGKKRVEEDGFVFSVALYQGRELRKRGGNEKGEKVSGFNDLS